MVRRQKKRSRKYHASRTWGGGNTKNRRGKGCRGGVGKGGSNRQKFTYFVKYDKDHFGAESRMNKNPKPEMNEINLWEISNRIEKGTAEKGSDGKYSLNLAGYKVLGAGKLEHAASITASAFSKSAEEKIKQAGGEAKLSAPAASA